MCPQNRKIKILVAEPFPPGALAPLEKDRWFALTHASVNKPIKKQAAGYDAILIRSHTQMTADVIKACGGARMIGRAGIGVDNIDVAAATRRGIAVVNVPAASTIAVAELTMGLIISLARKIPAAHQASISGSWSHSGYLGTELCGKTLGIIGLGRIGREVARRAAAFGMNLAACDPYIPDWVFETFGAVKMPHDQLLKNCDIVTLHVPLTDETRHMINARRLALMKKSAFLINASRGKVVDEKALIDALGGTRPSTRAKIAGAALDVMETEPPNRKNPIFSLPNIVFTPHIGAATAESRDRVMSGLCQSVRDFFVDGVLHNAVNAPDLDLSRLAELKPYFGLAEKMARLAAGLLESRPKSLRLEFRGELAKFNAFRLSRAVAKGVLAEFAHVNWVNALDAARRTGMKFSYGRGAESSGYTGLLILKAADGKNRVSISGTAIPGGGERIVDINGIPADLSPTGRWLVLGNRDKPGMIGGVGGILGRFRVNIADMRVGRDRPRGRAVMVFTVDQPVSAAALKQLRAIPDIGRVKVINLG